MARESVQKEVEVFRLYDLPPELRNLIYELHFLAACQDTRDLLSAAELAPKPDLTFVSKQIRSESLQLFNLASAEFWCGASFHLSLDCRTVASEEETALEEYQNDTFKKCSVVPSCATLLSLDFTIRTDRYDPIIVKVEVDSVASLTATCDYNVCYSRHSIVERCPLMESRLTRALGSRDQDTHEQGIGGAEVETVVREIHDAIWDVWA